MNRTTVKLLLVAGGTLLALKPALNWMERELPKPFIRERITVGKTSATVERIHRARYRFAAQYCAGQKVADSAAGEGYGTAMLREVAAGVDPYDREAFGDNILIDLEKDKWQRRYDVIVSLETIEHLGSPEFFRPMCAIPRTSPSSPTRLMKDAAPTPTTNRHGRRPS
jgi:hypothetical protein